MNCVIFMQDSSREEVKSFLESNKNKYIDENYRDYRKKLEKV